MENVNEEEIVNMVEIDLTKEVISKDKKLGAISIILYFLGYSIIGAIGLGIFCCILAGITLGVEGDLGIDLVMKTSMNYAYKLQILLDLVFVYLFIILWKSKLSFSVYKGTNIKKTLLLTLVFSLIFFFVNFVSGSFIGIFVGEQNSTNQEALIEMSKVAPLSIIFATVIFAPVVEEIVFRGSLFSLLKGTLSDRNIILVSATVFGLIHVFAGLSSGNLLELVYFFQYLFMGLILAFIYHKTKNLHMCIAVHMFSNIIAVILMFL